MRQLPPSHTNKSTVICESENLCRIFDVERSYARMIKFQKRPYIETRENNETNFGHKYNAHKYSSRFPKHPYDESALSRFEVLTKPLHKCNEDRPSFATQYQDIFIQYNEGFNFITGKSSAELKDAHVTIPEGTPPVTPNTEAIIRKGYVISQEASVYPKSEKYELFRKQNWLGAVHPNVQIDAKLNYVVSRILLEMEHTSRSFYKKICNLDRDLKQTALSY